MRCVVFLACFFALVAGPVPARDGDAIRDTIEGQIAAFHDSDVEAAFDYASPMIQRMFRTPEGFGAMVERGYPMVWRAQAVRFLALREEAGRLWQRVMITGPEGRLHLLDYEMREIDGKWRINGVVAVPQVGA